MKRLRFTADMTKEQKRNTVEAALLLGFQAETAVFPVAAADGEIPVSYTHLQYKLLDEVHEKQQSLDAIDYMICKTKK